MRALFTSNALLGTSARAIGFAIVSGAVISACTESGQVLSSVDEAQNAEATGGAPGAGSGGDTQSLGGDPDSIPPPGPIGDAVTVGAGDVHSCAVFDGELYCWGDNQNGSLGLGDFESRTTPVRVGTASDWSHVGSGDGFSCGVRAGIVWCWGRGSSGQLGVGQFTSTLVPLEVSLPEAATFLDVGTEHVCAIVASGALYCWGQNAEGQLAQADPWPGPGVNSALPLSVAAGEVWRSVACGQGHTCAIRDDGSLWCTGRNSRGELGLGPDAAQQLRDPVRVGVEVDWEQVSAGQNHTCGIRSGALYCWGDNSHTQLGVEVDDFATEPLLVPGIGTVTAVSVDTFHTCFIEQGGNLFCFGRNVEGQLGDGTTATRTAPTEAVPRGNWDQVSAGRFHTCGVRSGEVLCTGENVLGRLGVGDTARRSEFTPTAY